jgi:hypothetical protein
MSKEPYKSGLIKKSPYIAKREILGEIVAILDIIIDERGMKLIDPMSRALAKNSICEIAITDEEDASPGKVVNHVGYIGFMEVKNGGVAVVGDEVYISDRLIGVIAGFDTTHAPNHITLLLKADEVSTGGKLNLKIGNSVKILMS